GVRVYAGAIPLAVLAGWNVPLAIVLMSLVTLVYTWHGGLKAVVWVDVVQWVVYVAGGVAALWIATDLAGGLGPTLAMAGTAGKLKVLDPTLSFTRTYTLLGGLVGGAMLSAASHGTDQLIVQRLLASRNLASARWSLIGSGVVVLVQFALFLLIGTAIWAARQAPADLPADRIFPRFVVDHFPHGLSGLIVAAVLAASMATHSSAISALASSVTHDLYASWTGRSDPTHLFRVGRACSLAWGILITLVALGFNAVAGGGQTPVVVFALSIASITYGALLGAYLLAGGPSRVRGPSVIAGVAVAVVVMLGVFLTKQRLAWPWYVPVGSAITVAVGLTGGALSRPKERGA
ncbi:MAG TPA: hypothetical protein VEI47_01380, partial [Gemmatimonadales bacterium]|nr:hypothetical protein [Gemmatimonadales bacterium]